MMGNTHFPKADVPVLEALDTPANTVVAGVALPVLLAITTSVDAVTEVVGDSAATVSAETDEQVIVRLATLSPIEYDRVRKAEAKALGVQLNTLDDLVKAARDAKPAVELLPYEDFEPYPEPVDPAQVLNDIVAAIRSLVILDPTQADAAALWVAQTHVTEHAEISPIAIINAPEKACAKSLFQSVLAKMSKRPLQASNASLSAIFRAVGGWGSTLFADEGDTFLKQHPELFGVFNAGYAKGGVVLRSEAAGDSFEPRMFSVYGAKSIAGIALEKHLPDSTMSRGIHFNLRRKLAHETVQRMREFDKSIFATIGSKLARFAQDYGRQLGQAKPCLPKELSDRQQDCWEPLLAIAQIAGPEWEARALKAALSLSMAAETSVSTGNELLADIQFVFEAKKTFKISTVDLIDALTADAEKGWATYNRGKQLSPRQLAKQLATYGIHSKTVRMPNGSTPKGYDADQFADAFARYLATPEKLPQQGNAATQTVRATVSTVADTTHQATTGDSGGATSTEAVRPTPLPPETLPTVDAAAPQTEPDADEDGFHQWATQLLGCGGVADTFRDPDAEPDLDAVDDY